MMWSEDERFTAWLDKCGLGTAEHPLDDDTLDLMYDAWREGRRKRIADSVAEAEEKGLYELSEHATSSIDLGCYRLHITQGQGGMVAGEFYSLEDALEAAAENWGEGAIGIEKPDGSWHEFSEDWKMPPKLILMRPRKGKLNPRQEYVRKQWLDDRYLRQMLHSLEENPLTPGRVLNQLAEIMEDLGGGWRAAKDLFSESLDWGIFELFEWQNGWPKPGEYLDEGIAAGQVKSL